MFIVQPLRSHHVALSRQVYLWRVSEHIMFEVNDTKQTQRGVIQQLDGFIISTLILSACMNTQRNVTAASLLCGDSYISCRWLTLKLVEVSAQDAKLVTQKTNLHKCLKICLATVWLHNMFFFFSQSISTHSSSDSSSSFQTHRAPPTFFMQDSSELLTVASSFLPFN